MCTKSSRHRRLHRPIAALVVAAVVALGGCGAESGDEGGDILRCGPGERRVVGADGRAICQAPSETPDATAADTGTGGGEDTGTSAPDATATDTGAEDTSVAPDSSPPEDTQSPSDTGVGDVAEDTQDTADEDVVPVEPVTRFVAIGDVGEGSPEQYHVASSIGLVCGQLGGCDFAVMLGDNFYDSGVSSVDDSMFDSHFAQPYGPLGFPFYAVLGNHDLGGEGIGIDLDFRKGDYQVAYSQRNPQWRMPSKHYQFSEGPLWFAALNTTDVFFDQDDDQYRDVSAWLAQYEASGDTRWKIAFGHHPYISNGKHGNAGNYENIPDLGSLSDIPRGKHVQDFMRDNVCGKFDVYLSGHDHSRQDLHATCGTEFLISGAGAKTTEVVPGRNPSYFQADTTGFLIVEATSRTMRFAFYDRNGTLEHERSISR